MEPFGFERLPEVVRQLFEKVEHIEEVLSYLRYEQAVEKKFLSVKEAADYLHISVAAIYSLVSRRQIPVNKPGKRLYFLNAELDEWIKAGKLKTSDEIEKEAHQYLKAHRRK